MNLERSRREAILYSRPDCPLCFALLRSARRSARRHGLVLRVVDVSTDPTLLARYGREVPVLLMPGGRSILGRASHDSVEALFEEAARPRFPRLRRYLGRLWRARGGA